MCDIREKRTAEEVECEKEEMRLQQENDLKSSQFLSSAANRRKQDNTMNNKFSRETNQSISAMAAASTDDFSNTFLAVIKNLSEQVNYINIFNIILFYLFIHILIFKLGVRPSTGDFPSPRQDRKDAGIIIYPC